MAKATVTQVPTSDHGVIESYWCLCTKVRNPQSQAHTYTYLPFGGSTLAAGAELVVPGDLVGNLLVSRSVGSWSRVHADALARDIRDERIEIVHTIAPWVEDLCTDETYILQAENGLAVAVLPCFEGQEYCEEEESSSEG